jgi:hypothetical protein
MPRMSRHDGYVLMIAVLEDDRTRVTASGALETAISSIGREQ